MAVTRIAAAQTPEFLEDVDGALGWLSGLIAEAEAQEAALLCLPEGFLQGYLTDEDSARRHALDLGSPAFTALLDRLPRTGPTFVMGLMEIEGGRLYNTAVVLHRGALLGRYRKTHLLGRERAFTPGADSPTFAVGGLRFGINICYDTNFPQAARKVADGGAELIVCLANNMLPRQTAETWKDAHNAVRGDRCRETSLWMISADVTGERDGAVAWGPTAVLNPAGEVVAQLPLGSPGLLVFDLPSNPRPAT